MRPTWLFALALVVAATPARADSLQALAAAGLSLPKNPDLTIDQQDVTITLATITQRYVIQNHGAKPVATTLTFRLPPVDMSDPDTTYAMPTDDPVDFIALKVVIDGKPADFTYRQTAEVAGKDVSKRLLDAKLPLLPSSEFQNRIAALPAAQLEKMSTDALLAQNGTDPKGTPIYTPTWTVRTTATRRQTINPGQVLTIESRSMTSLGASQDTSLRKALRSEAALQPQVDETRKAYCIDEAFIGGVDKMAGTAAQDAAGLEERRVQVKLGPIADGAVGAFHLSLDKGKPDNLVSVCLDNLKKTSPTSFEFTASDYMPPGEIKILVVGRF